MSPSNQPRTVHDRDRLAYGRPMELEFTGTVIEWRGPAPYYFVSMPEKEAGVVDDHKQLLTYGWGAIPATVTLGSTAFTTSLFPKDGSYLVPLKDKVRAAEGVQEGDDVHLLVTLDIGG
jgi:hypothetical protein